jgi:endoglucanase
MRIALAAMVILIGIVLAAAAGVRSDTEPKGHNPLAGLNLYDGDPSLGVQKRLAEDVPDKEADAARAIAAQPQGHWVGAVDGGPRGRVNALVTDADATNQTPIIVLYNIPYRDCGQHSAGGTETAAAYRSWVNDVAAGIGNRKAIVILEPDALPGWDCLIPAEQKERQELLSYAVEVLKANSGTIVYIDGGNAQWLSPDEMAGRLRTVNISKADGFTVNVSNYFRTDESVAYGQKISSILGGKHFVVDTSRNGQGPAGPHEWCNPPGRGLGLNPKIAPGPAWVDAYLWIKNPGESDGTCNGGPKAGAWWADQAIELVKLRER